VTTCDYLLDDIRNACQQSFIGGTVIGTGGSPQSGVVLGRKVITEQKIRDVIIPIIQSYGVSGLVDDVRTVAGLVVQRASSPTSAMQVQIPVFTADALHVIQILQLQVS
jgi:hypothetical protein